MKIVDIKDKSSIQSAADVLKSGGVLIFPTDTVYGIGCGLNEKAISILYKIKNRSLDKPTAILMSNNDVPELLQKYYKKYPKGQVTIIANADKYKMSFPEILHKENKIGVRVPNDHWLQNLLKISGPIVASSANMAGDTPPKKYSDINPDLLEQVDLIIKSDHSSLNSSSNLPSTVYDIEQEKIIRA